MEIIRVTAQPSIPAANALVSSAATKRYLADGWPLAANTDNGANTGRVFYIKARGAIVSGVAPGTIQISINIGTTALCVSAAVTLPASLLGTSTSGYFELDATAALVIAGTSGAWIASGRVIIDNATVPVILSMVPTVGTGTTGQVTINTQTAATLQIGIAFSDTTSANTITATIVDIRETV